MPPIATHVTVAWSVCMSSVTLMHPPKAVGRNEMPFGKLAGIPVWFQVTLYYNRSPGPPRKVEIFGALGVGTPVHSDAAPCFVVEE